MNDIEYNRYERPTAYVGIDPGRSGAAAIWTSNNKVGFWQWDGRREAYCKIAEWGLSYDIVGVAIEDVNFIHPDCGVMAIRVLNQNIGFWNGLLIGMGYRVVNIPVRTWQKMLPPVLPPKGHKVTDLQKKYRSLYFARELVERKIPGAQDLLPLKKDHNKAEALLLAYYLRREDSLRRKTA